MPTSLVALHCYYYIIYARALQYIFNFFILGKSRAYLTSGISLNMSESSFFLPV